MRRAGEALAFGRSLCSSSSIGFSPRQRQWRRANLNTRLATCRTLLMLDSASPLARRSRTSRAASVTSIASMRRLPHYLAWIDLLEQEDLEDAAAAREGMVRAARGWLEVHATRSESAATSTIGCTSTTALRAA